jgi:N-acetylmuramoyl-L-alanine amidase
MLSKEDVMRVFINPGHAEGGVPDPGACYGGLRESDIAASVGELVEMYLQKAGCETMRLQSHCLIHESPGYPSVTELANQWDADIFLSIHVNAGGGRGAECLVYDTGGEAEKLARSLMDEYIPAMRVFDETFGDRGILRRPSLAVLRATQMPAALIELGFIDSEDRFLLASAQDTMARALARGVTDYENLC